MTANRSRVVRKFVAALICVAALAWPSPVNLIGAAVTHARSQSQSSAAPKYEFDVVSIKIVGPDDNGADFGIGFSPNAVTANGVRMWWLFRVAYDMPKPQVVGAPKWFDDVRFRIDARVDPATAAELQKLSPKDLTSARQQMLRSIMADRFGLSFHLDTRELPAYFLTVGKDGPKLQDAKPGYVGKSDSPDLYGNRATDFVTMNYDGQFTLVSQAASMQTFASYLAMWALSFSGENTRPVVDKTGLTGRYDFTIKFVPDSILVAPSFGDGTSVEAHPATLAATGPNLFKALQDTLGLKLQQGKGPVPV
ncbi:MAG TPA: TIGR03435 family protein, partial [Candidatus Acidoferrales bacterium]|nr:TIGR03435 family protein [Candidatus Acidoferrales bacterium]